MDIQAETGAGWGGRDGLLKLLHWYFLIDHVQFFRSWFMKWETGEENKEKAQNIW